MTGQCPGNAGIRSQARISKPTAQKGAGKKGVSFMKSKEELLQMFNAALWELQETNNENVKSRLRYELELLLYILENDIDDEYVEIAEMLLSRSY